MNLNNLAREITLYEGLKKPISIAQVKEVMRLLFNDMAYWDPREIDTVLRRYANKSVK